MTVGMAIEAYVRHLRRRGRSEQTITSYLWALHQLQATLDPGALMERLDTQDLERWQDRLLERSLQRSSRAQAVTAVRSWLRWAIQEELVDWRLMRGLDPIRRPRGRPHPIPQPDLDKVKLYLEKVGPRSPLIELRDRALFYVLLTSGFRISEVLQLRRADWEGQVVTQKGGDPKALVVPPSVVQMVEEYLRARGDGEPALWISLDSNRPVRPLTGVGAGRIWIRLARRVGVRAWTNHELRHSCGTEMARAGVPMQVIRDHLGHVGLDMTLRYVAVVEEQQAQKLEALERLARLPKKLGPPGQTERGWVRMRGRVDRRSRPA